MKFRTLLLTALGLALAIAVERSYRISFDIRPSCFSIENIIR